MVDVDISIIFAGLSIAASIVYYASVLRNANKTQQMQLETRQAQLFMQIYRDICTPEWWGALGEVLSNDWSDYDVMEERFMEDPRLLSRGQALFAFFEGLGVLVYRKLIDPYLVDDLLSGPIIRYWEATQNYFIERRVRRSHPPIAEWIEYLYNQIKPIVEEQHPELRT